MTELCQLSFGTLVRCGECGLIRVFPPRSSQQLVAVHSRSEFFHHRYFETRRDLGQSSLVAQHCALLSHLTDGLTVNGARLLDVGCDTGSLMTVARDKFGMDVMGVEILEEAAHIARQQHGLDVVVGQLDELELPAAGFDLITLVDVIEHAADPEALLNEVARLLRTGGRVYIETSNGDALMYSMGLSLHQVASSWSKGLLERLFAPYHEFYFNQSTLARLVERSGLRVRHHVGREMSLDDFGARLALKAALAPIMLLQRLTSRPTLQEMTAVKEG